MPSKIHKSGDLGEVDDATREDFDQLERLAASVEDAALPVFKAWSRITRTVKPYNAMTNLTDRTQAVVLQAIASFSRSNTDFLRLEKSPWGLTTPQLIQLFACPSLVSRDFVHALADMATSSKDKSLDDAMVALQSARQARQTKTLPYVRGANTHKAWTPADVFAACDTLQIAHKQLKRRKATASNQMTTNQTENIDVTTITQGRTETPDDKLTHAGFHELEPSPKKRRIEDNQNDVFLSAKPLPPPVELARRAPMPLSPIPEQDGDDSVSKSVQQPDPSSSPRYDPADLEFDSDADFPQIHPPSSSPSPNRVNVVPDFSQNDPDNVTGMSDTEYPDSDDVSLFNGSNADSSHHSPTAMESSYVESAIISKDVLSRVDTPVTQCDSAAPPPEHNVKQPEDLDDRETRQVAKTIVEVDLENFQSVIDSRNVNTLRRLAGTRKNGWLSHIDITTILKIVLPSSFEHFEIPSLDQSTNWSGWADIGLKRTINPNHTIFSVLYDAKRKHWVLLEILPINKLVSLYDSMHDRSMDVSQAVHSIVRRLGFDWDSEKWQFVKACTPQQVDASSCGVFAVACVVHRTVGAVPPEVIDAHLWRFALQRLLDNEDKPLDIESALSSFSATAASVGHKTALAQTWKTWIVNEAETTRQTFVLLQDMLERQFTVVQEEQRKLCQGADLLKQVLPTLCTLTENIKEGHLLHQAHMPFAHQLALQEKEMAHTDREFHALQMRLNRLARVVHDLMQVKTEATRRLRQIIAEQRKACIDDLKALEDLEKGGDLQ